MNDNNFSSGDAGEINTTATTGEVSGGEAEAKKANGSSDDNSTDSANEFADIDNDENLFSYQKEALKKERIEAKKKAATGGKVDGKKDDSGEEEETEVDSKEAKAKDPKEKTKETPAEPKKYTVVVDGEKLEVDEKELIKGYQLSRASAQKITEATELKKKAQGVVNLLQQGEDGLEYLLEAVHGPVKAREILEKALYKKLSIEKMDPNARKAYEAEIELERYREMERQLKEQQALQQEQQAVEQYKQQYVKIVDDTLKQGGLPNTSFVKAQIVQAMNILIGKGHEASPETLIPYVKKQIFAHQKEMFELDPEQFVKTFGEEAAEKWRDYLNNKYDSSKRKLPPKVKAEDGAGKPAKASTEKPKFKTWEEWSAWKNSQLED